MKILIAGANGYIGKRLIPELLALGHELFCCVRDKSRFELTNRHERLRTIGVNFVVDDRPPNFPRAVDVACYLIHSMNSTIGNFAEEERRAAVNFLQFLEPTTCRQIIYLSGIVNEEKLSTHLSSRLTVEQRLRAGCQLGGQHEGGHCSAKNNLAEELGITLLPYQKAVELALAKIEQGNVISGWKDSFASSGAKLALMNSAIVPTDGCFTDVRVREVAEPSGNAAGISAVTPAGIMATGYGRCGGCSTNWLAAWV